MLKTLREFLTLQRQTAEEQKRMADEIVALRAALGQMTDRLEAVAHAGNAILATMADDVAHRLDPRHADPKSIGRNIGHVFSQNAEDSMIAEIFSRIGTTDRTFVEIGIGDGRENNTRWLLSGGWSGHWFDGNAAEIEAARTRFAAECADGRLSIHHRWFGRDDAGEALRQAGVPGLFDFLSVDIDMATYQVWESLADFNPRVVCVEYNAHVPPQAEFVVPFVEGAAWQSDNHFGAGLKSLELLGRRLGYSLVGCDFLGVNAFFVRDDLVGDRFQAPYTAEQHYQPPRFPLVRHRGHPHQR